MDGTADSATDRGAARLTRALALVEANPAVTIEQVRTVLGRHSLLAPLWLLALIAIPAAFVPFGSTILGIPMLALSIQLALGRPQLWLPGRLLHKPAPRAWLLWLYPRVITALQNLETLIKPRYPQFTQSPYKHLSGFLCVALTLAVALPIPLGNIAPSLAVAALALGHMEEDGALIACGQIVGLLTLGVLSVVVALVFGSLGAGL